MTREKVNAEPARSLVQAPALSAGCLAAFQAQLLGPAIADSSIVVGVVPLPVLSTGLPTMGLLAKD